MSMQGTYIYEYPRPAVTTDCVLFCSDDARDARWFPVSALPPLAFDHNVVLRDALQRLETDSH